MTDRSHQPHGQGDGLERAYVAGTGRRYLYQVVVGIVGGLHKGNADPQALRPDL